MKTLLSILLVVTGLSTSALAQLMPGDSPITEVVNPTYTCGDQDGAIFINVPDKKVWMGDLSEKEGIELQVSEITQARCMDCLLLKATLTFAGTVAEWDMSLDKQLDGKILLSGTIKSVADENPEPLTVECTKN